jgi:hypothetical protein
MIAIAKAMTDDEIKATAEHFGSMRMTQTLCCSRWIYGPNRNFDTTVRPSHFG